MALALIELGGRTLGMDVRSAAEKSLRHGHRFVALIGDVPNPCTHSCSGECRRSGCNCRCGEYHAEPSADYPLGGSAEPYDIARDAALTE